MIHLGYAFELSSKEIAMEALGLATTNYNSLHKYLDDPSYTKPSTYSTSSPLEILQRVHNDKRLDGSMEDFGAGDESLFIDHEAVVLEHWNAWHISNPKKQFEDSQYAAAALLTATHESAHEKYDFFIVHLLTSSHAIRILLPFLPAERHVSLVRQWWLLTLTVYISQKRPEIKLDRVKDYDLEGKDWNWVDKKAVDGKWNTDSHYVKAIRAMKEAANTWGDSERIYLKAATKFGAEFDGWGGFPAAEP